MTIDNQKYTYYAFISYKREDEKWAKWLQKKLESYSFPISLRKEHMDLPTKIRPVFRDQSELSGGYLKDEIEKGLAESKYLIVICSPHAAKSPWVSKEVQYFIDYNREKFIIPFIIAGSPNATNTEDECFPEELHHLSCKREILGININEMGRDAAVIKVIAHMFNLRFDILWQRHERARKERQRIKLSLLMFITFGGLAIGAYFIHQNNIISHQNQILLKSQSRIIAAKALQLAEDGDYINALALMTEVYPHDIGTPERPLTQEAYDALRILNESHFDKIFYGHLKMVNSAQFNPNGDKIVTASDDNTARIWNVNTGECVKILKGHYGGVRSAQFNSDGTRIITASLDRTIRIWDSKTGECLSVRKCNEGVLRAEFMPDEDWIIYVLYNEESFIAWNPDPQRLINMTLNKLNGYKLSDEDRKLHYLD